MDALEHTRAIALALPGVTESDHHGMASFRVNTRIFATVPEGEHVRVMAGEESIRAAVETDASACAPFYWGKRLACVVVEIQRVDPALLSELLEEAWLRKAPATLARAYREDGAS